MSYNREYNAQCCVGSCGGHVYLSAREHAYHRERGTWFYCSNGHKQHFSPSEVDKLREEIKRLEHSRDRYERLYEREVERWKCPYGGCYYDCYSKGSLVGHINREHNHMPETRQLPKDAGPDALNTTIH